MKRYENFIIAIALLLLDAFWAFNTLALPADPSTPYDTRFFPFLIIGGLALCSVIFIIKGFTEKPKQMSDEDLIKCEAGNRKKVLMLILLVFVYIALFEFLGFFLSSLIYLIVAQIIFGVRSKVTLFAVTPAILLVLNVVFVMAFKIPLP